MTYIAHRNFDNNAGGKIDTLHKNRHTKKISVFDVWYTKPMFDMVVEN